MTPQEIFNMAWEKVTAQGHASISPETCDCAYRMRDGARCAAGHLMNEDEISFYGDYDGSIDFLLREEDEGRSVVPLRPFFRDHMFLIAEIQKAHDYSSHLMDRKFVDNFQENMREVARKFGLEAPQ